MHSVYLGIGTNIEPRLERMELAIRSLNSLGRVEKKSSTYETDPFGYTDQAAFLNAVVLLSTELDLMTLHRSLQALEKELGRIERIRWHEREIDFDILFFDDVVLNTEILTVPHPELQHRSFVLVPLTEIAPDLVHPVLQKTMSQLLENLSYSHDSIKSFREKSEV